MTKFVFRINTGACRIRDGSANATPNDFIYFEKIVSNVMSMAQAAIALFWRFDLTIHFWISKCMVLMWLKWIIYVESLLRNGSRNG